LSYTEFLGLLLREILLFLKFNNLNNRYYTSIEKLTLILLNDFDKGARKYSVLNNIIFSIILTGSIVNTLIFWKMMIKLE